MFALRHGGQVARLVLDRPEARNAIPLSGWDELHERLAEVERSASRLLVIAGAGSAFCAGADLSDFDLLSADAGARPRLREAMGRALARLRTLPMPTIAAIEGSCYGAGVALAIACDFRVASASARFAITPARFGLSYPQEDVHRLVELVGRGQAARLLFTALPIDGAEAARIGLVELHAPDGALDPIVAAVLEADPASLAVLKRGIGLAAEGHASDPEQDRRFDALIGGESLRRRLEARRRK